MDQREQPQVGPPSESEIDPALQAPRAAPRAAADAVDLNSTIGTDSNHRAADSKAKVHKPTVGSLSQLSWDSHASQLPEKIGRYVLVEKLGSGSYGVVYRARDEALGRFVAIKLLTRFENLHEVDAWLSEARVLASLDHVAIVPVYDVGKTESGQPFIVSKLIAGGTLGQKIAKAGCSVEDSVRMATQLADALDYLHRRGVMHRDIKPGNILTTPEGDAILADFGLALDETGYGKGARFVGTPAYMSPEQARSEGHRVDGRSDIYSLGVVLYELLTGTRPFKADNQVDLLDCIRNVEVRPLRQLNPRIPRELERICLRALAKKIADRYSTAGDLANELRSWGSAADLQSTVAVSPVVPDHTDSKPSQRSLDLSNIAVVPHGLRPFDAGDADFFNFLLPGAKDRNGVPDCVSFWTHRIASRNPAETFRVAVLLGPSGSGKSSLMRAGVLPLVREQVRAIYIEAKPDSLEANLLKQLRHKLPAEITGGTLRETLIRFRQSNKERHGPKLVIVIDQFEQWLNHHREQATTELHEALRQCDGENVQTILLVRDDFMLGLSSFMDQLEEFLLQNQNFATVESFGVLHAKKVLSAMGRAYGTLREDLTADQEAFLDASIGELSRAGRLAPVQLAVLSEMIKDKPWTAATLKSLGGVEGLGVAFLEDRLAGNSAHPLLRSELPVVRRILAEMLPVDDTVIKPPACAQSVLLERLGGIASEELLRKMLDLLDTEVRLITPTSSASPGAVGTGVSDPGSTLGSASADPAYQLTHDFLVPTTRKWLASLDSGTRAGRVRQQLREMAIAWNAKPTNKRLPSLLEWSSMRWFVHPKEWNPGERRMIRATEWRVAKLAGVGLVAAAVLGSLGFFSLREIRVQALADRLLDADTGSVTTVLRAVEPYRAWVLPRLEQSNAAHGDPQTAARRKLHIALAKLDETPSEAEYVFEELDAVEDRHLGFLVGYLSDRRSIDDRQLLERLQASLRESNPNALALSALFASRQPEHAAWGELARDVARLAVSKRSSQIGFWPELLMPIRARLLPALVEMVEAAPPASGSELDNHLLLVSAFAQEEPASIARVVGHCLPEALPNLLATKSSSLQLSVELREQLAAAAGQLGSNRSSAAEDSLNQKLHAFNGQVAHNGGWAAQIPWSKLNETLEWMRAGGYCPTSIRPYPVNGVLFVAASWLRKPDDDYLLETGLDSAALLKRFNELQQQGSVMLDFAEYALPTTDLTDPQFFWLGLWRKPTETPAFCAQQLTLKEDGAATDGYIPQRVAVHVDDRGTNLFSTLWNRAEQTEANSVTWARMQRSAGDLWPAYCHADMRSLPVSSTRERGLNWTNYTLQLSQIPEGRKPNARELVNIVTHLSASGEPNQALEQLSQLTDADYARLSQAERAVVRRGVHRQQARALARLGRAEELQALLDETIGPGEFTQAEKDFLYLRLAILKQELASVTRRLQALEQVADRSNLTDDYFLRGLALVAAADYPDGISEAALQKLLARAPLSIAKNEALQSAFLDFDFDGVRNREPWQRLLESLKLSQLYAVCGTLQGEEESRLLLDQSLAAHSRSSLQLCREGFAPACINVRADMQGDLHAGSVWHRKNRSNSELAAVARRIAVLSLALAKIGEADGLRDGLSEKWGRSVQSALVVHGPKVLPGDYFVAHLRETSSASMQSALVSILGGYKPSELSDENRRYVRLRLDDWANNAPDATLLNHARWCLQQWEVASQQPYPQPLISADHNWFTNAIGQQMIVVEPPELVLNGKNDHHRVWVHIGRRFALASQEVTGEDYAQFLEDPRVQAWIERDRPARNRALVSRDQPQTASWLHAILFCQWLNEKQGIPEAEWCYKHVWSDEHDLAPEADYLNRTGYRLPTLAEREWACAAGSDEAWHFGSDESLISHYEWTLPHSENISQPVGRKRPNRLGFFDMSGNLAEWVDNAAALPLRPDYQFFLNDSGNKDPIASKNRVLCGGRFRFSAQSATSNTSVYEPLDYLSPSTGFRVARTLKD